MTVVSAGGLFLFPEVGRNYFLVIPIGYSIMRIEKYGFMEMKKRLFIRVTIEILQGGIWDSVKRIVCI